MDQYMDILDKSKPNMPHLKVTETGLRSIRRTWSPKKKTRITIMKRKKRTDCSYTKNATITAILSIFDAIVAVDDTDFDLDPLYKSKVC